MVDITTLSEEKLGRYREAGLSDKEIELLNTPLADLNKGELAAALYAKDKM